ncbi:hypothetical protein T4E_9112 [Trichinella pseudospiralis]|uniref:Uncharacterized protein n=1 Tax=Trichinella pseudospiralis TaxID=6337 RepID=A0A0V0YNV4_TRIPS|nr:hypothetical protein T4E_9112 [Trichinella pseudospiralis]
MDAWKRKRDSRVGTLRCLNYFLLNGLYLNAWAIWVGNLLALVVCIEWTDVHSRRRSASLFPLGHRLFIKGFYLSTALCIEFWLLYPIVRHPLQVVVWSSSSGVSCQQLVKFWLKAFFHYLDQRD